MSAVQRRTEQRRTEQRRTVQRRPVQPVIPPTPLRTFLAMARRNGPIPMRRWPRLALYVARHLSFAPLRALEGALHNRAIRQQPLAAPPVFIVGHWRSGTSFLQTLFGVDPQMTTNTVYRAVFPGTYLLTERWLKPALGLAARALRLDYEIQRSRLDFDLVAEADVALCLLGSAYAYSWGHLYPERFEAWMRRLVLAPSAAERDGWLAHQDFLLRKLSYAAGGRRVVSKTPGDMGRVAALRAQYPEARFVYISRDPIDVFHSNLYLWDVIQRRIALQTLPRARLEEIVIGTWRELMQAHRAQWAAVPAAQRVSIDYAELRRDPIACMRGVYAALGLGPAPEEAWRRFLADQPAYRGGRYETSPALRARLEAAWQLEPRE